MDAVKIKRDFIRLKLVLFGVLFLCTVSMARAQKNRQSPGYKKLYAEILHMDSVLFNAFNTRDLGTIKKIFAADVELYQDNDGLKNYEQSMAGFANIFSKEYVLTRKLVPGSMEVFPLKTSARYKPPHTFFHTWKTERWSAAPLSSRISGKEQQMAGS